MCNSVKTETRTLINRQSKETAKEDVEKATTLWKCKIRQKEKINERLIDERMEEKGKRKAEKRFTGRRDEGKRKHKKWGKNQ